MPTTTATSDLAIRNSSALREWTDSDLVAGLTAGCPQAWRDFRALLEPEIRKAIHRVRSRFPGLLSSDDVNEVFSELSLQLVANDMHRLRCFDPSRGTPLSSWLCLLARNCCFDLLRRRRRHPSQASTSELFLIELAPTDQPDPFSRCAAREELDQILSLMEALPQRDQEFIALYYGQGLSPEQTAERLGVQVSTVYSKKHKIRARIEGLLEKPQAA